VSRTIHPLRLPFEADPSNAVIRSTMMVTMLVKGECYLKETLFLATTAMVCLVKGMSLPLSNIVRWPPAQVLKGDIEARYGVNKGLLPREKVRDMKESYRKALRFLQTTATGASEDDKANFKSLVATAVDIGSEDLARLDFLGMSDAELHNLVKQRLAAVMKNNGAKQKVVPAVEVERCILQGWEYVANTRTTARRQ